MEWLFSVVLLKLYLLVVQVYSAQAGKTFALCSFFANVEIGKRIIISPV